MNESLVVEHSTEVANALMWVIGGLSTALMLLISLIAKLILNRFDRIEKAINEVAKEIEEDISIIRAKLQEVDARVTTVETKVKMYHESG